RGCAGLAQTHSGGVGFELGSFRHRYRAESASAEPAGCGGIVPGVAPGGRSPMKRSACVIAVLIVWQAGLAFGQAATQPSGGPVELPPPLPPLITPETQRAIDRGLEYLARTQSREGAWRNQGYMGQYPVAMTALAG